MGLPTLAARCMAACLQGGIVLAMGLAPVLGHAAELRWAGRPFQIAAAEKPLADFLRELAASQGTTAVLDQKVSGTISGKFGGAALQVLDSVCGTHGLTWYFDGAFLFIEPATEALSEVLAVGNATRVAETLQRLGIADARFPLTLVDRAGRGALHVAGPRRYLEMVKQTIKLIDAPAPSADTAEIRIYPLKYAWAADLSLARAGKEEVVPGVVTSLRALFSRSARSSASGGARTSPATLRMGPERRIKLRSGDSVDAPKIELPSASSAEETLHLSAADDLPQFQADSRLNAVIVRDLPSRMAQYGRLIESMDVRPRLVEIEVTIMDISSDTLDSLGIDWRLHGRHGDAQTGRGDATPLVFDEPGGATATPMGALLNVTIGHDARNFLLARVSALAQRGNADLVARPKVLTLDSVEAVLENLSEFHVRVSGFQDAGLFSVTTGSAVRVTPKLIDDAGTTGVMMSLHISDGDVSGASVDQIPVVRRRAILTQAMVDEGQSLLIAGYTSEEKIQATTGVPLLSDLPVLGPLFRHEEKKRTRMERFYLLTPRLVSARGTNPLLPPARLPTPATAPSPAVVSPAQGG